MTFPSESLSIGFITVLRQPNVGLIGGYLVLNPLGLPREFHCTTPIKPNIAQEILYGESLYPFFFGEIAKKLLRNSKFTISHLLTDTAAVLPMQEDIDPPLVYVFDAAKKQKSLFSEKDETKTEIIEISEELKNSLKSFGIDPNTQRRTEENTAGLQLPQVIGLNTDEWQEKKIGNRTIAVPCCRTNAVEELTCMAKMLDIAEPFNRIFRAVEEAQRAA